MDIFLFSALPLPSPPRSLLCQSRRRECPRLSSIYFSSPGKSSSPRRSLHTRKTQARTIDRINDGERYRNIYTNYFGNRVEDKEKPTTVLRSILTTKNAKMARKCRKTYYGSVIIIGCILLNNGKLLFYLINDITSSCT